MYGMEWPIFPLVPVCPRVEQLKLFFTALRVWGSYTARLLAFSGDFLFSSGQILFHNGLRGCQQFVLRFRVYVTQPHSGGAAASSTGEKTEGQD